MVILGNLKDNYDTATTANKLMGFDLSATQSCLSFLLTILSDMM